MPKLSSSNSDARSNLLSEFGRVQEHAGARYVGWGPWFVAERELALAKVLSGLMRPVIPGAGVKVYGNLVGNRLRNRAVVLPVENTALQISDRGTRVRSFDPLHNVSRKLVARDSKYGVGIDNDLSVRSGLLKDAGVRHPILHSTREVRGYVFLEEELIRGRRFKPFLDGRHTEQHVVAPLSRLMLEAGLKHVPLAEALGATNIEHVLGLDRTQDVVRRALDLVERNPIVAVGFAHGDLWPSNLAVDRSGVVFLDWENAGYRLIGFDLLRLWRKYPRVKALARGANTLIKRHQIGNLDLYDTACLHMSLRRQRSRGQISLDRLPAST